MRSFILLGAICIANAINPDYEPEASAHIILNIMFWAGAIMDAYDWLFKGE